MSAQASATRPGGRSRRVREAVYAAVGELIGEGAGRPTFPTIAERAGVNPTTLYRRWTDVDTLLEEVSVATLTRDGESPADTGSLEGDLLAWARLIADDITRPERTAYLRAMLAARGESAPCCPVTEKRRAQAGTVIDRARERGEAAPSADQLLDHVIAPLYYRVVFGLEVDRDYPVRLVRDALALAT